MKYFSLKLQLGMNISEYWLYDRYQIHLTVCTLKIHTKYLPKLFDQHFLLSSYAYRPLPLPISYALFRLPYYRHQLMLSHECLHAHWKCFLFVVGSWSNFRWNFSIYKRIFVKIFMHADVKKKNNEKNTNWSTNDTEKQRIFEY